MIGRSLAKQIVEANRNFYSDQVAYFYDEHYNYSKNKYYQEKFRDDVEFIFSLFPKDKKIQVLDLGTGTGFLSCLFLKRNTFVMSIDISPSMLEVFKQKLKKKNLAGNIKLICQDIDTFLLQDKKKYDIVCGGSVLHHLPDYLKTLKKLIPKLHPGGTLYFNHEPIGKTSSFFHKDIVPRLYLSSLSVLMTLIAKMKNLFYYRKVFSSPPKIVDYHYWHGGCDERKILKLLKESGFLVLKFKKYNLWLLDRLARFDNKFLRLHRPGITFFSLIARKQLTEDKRPR